MTKERKKNKWEKMKGSLEGTLNGERQERGKEGKEEQMKGRRK